jgi:hypothetical protein
MLATTSAKTSSSEPIILVLGLLVFLALYVCICHLIARAAARKGRSYGAWFAIALFVSPVLAAIIIAAVSPSPHGPPNSTGFVACPRCAESIRTAAKACRYCGAEFSI